MYCTIFQADNYSLFLSWSVFTSGGTMEAMVDQHRTSLNGRAAWSTIVAMMDGQDSNNARIKDADVMD